MTDNDVFCSCKACRKKRIKEAKEFTEQYGEFRTRSEIFSSVFKGDTVPLNVLQQRAESVIQKKNAENRLQAEFKKRQEQEEKQKEIDRLENERIEKEDQERLIEEWRVEKDEVIQKNKELTKSSLQQIDEVAKNLDTTDPIALQDFGVILQRSFNAISENVTSIFEKSEVKRIKKTVALLLEKAGNYEGIAKDEYIKIKKDLEVLQAELSPLSKKSEDIVLQYNKQYENLEKLVNNIDVFMEAGNKCLNKIEQEKKAISLDVGRSDLQTIGRLEDINSMYIRLSRRVEGLTMTKSQAISFALEINGMKNVERAFVDELSNIIYNVIPTWNSKAKTYFEMKELDEIKLDLKF